MNTPNPAPVTTTAEDAQEVAAVPLPCPFCGHAGLLGFSEGSTFRWLVAACEGCGASAGETHIQTLGEGARAEWQAQAQRDAIAEWNKRAPVAVATSDAERAAFEAHYAKIWKERTHKRESLEDLRAVLVTMRDDDGYNNGAGEHPAFINNLWEGWQAHAALPIDFKQATDQGGWQPVGVPRGWRIVPDEEGTTVVSPSGDSCYLWDLDSRHAEAGQVHREVLRQLSQDLLFAPAESEWQFVPKAPTPAMVEAGANTDPERESIWAAMLAAAPTLLGVADGDAVGGKSGGAK